MTNLRRRAVALTGAAALVTTALISTGRPADAQPSHPDRMVLSGSAPTGLIRARTVGAVSKDQPETVQLWLTPDLAGATRAADAISTPGSAQFHHYLSPNDYTSRYGASTGRVAAVSHWLVQQGFGHISVDPQRNYIRADATAARAESAFAVQLRRYRVRGSGGKESTVVSNDREVSLPSNVASDVVAVTGLTSTQPQTFLANKGKPTGSTKPKAPICSTYYGQHSSPKLPRYKGATKYPLALCGYHGSDLRAAYGMNSANVGKGQTVAYVEVGTPFEMAQTLTTWAASNGLPKPKPSQYSELSLGHGVECGNPFDVEEQLDVEAGYAMAPAAHHLLIGGDGCETAKQGLQALFDADLEAVNGTGSAPLSTIVSNSWGVPREDAIPPSYAMVMHTILLRAAAEGVGMYFASGDFPGSSIPADDPYAISVGGTTLGVDAKKRRLFETGWSDLELDRTAKHTQWVDEGINRTAAGGGTSLLWSEPSYQKGVVPTSMSTPGAGDHPDGRTVPDLSALADPFTGIREGVTTFDDDKVSYYTLPEGGTSLAAPLVAGMIAAVQQGQPRAFGFLNPTLYSLHSSSAFNDVLPVGPKTPAANRAVFIPSNNHELLITDHGALISFDAELPQYTQQVTAKGYDTMTGLGTPRGQEFIAALRRATR